MLIKTVADRTVAGSVSQRLMSEASVMSRLESPFLKALLQVGREDGDLYLVPAFVAGMTLAERRYRRR